MASNPNLAAIRGIKESIAAHDAQIEDLKDRLAELTRQRSSLEKMLAQLAPEEQAEPAKQRRGTTSARTTRGSRSVRIKNQETGFYIDFKKTSNAERFLNLKHSAIYAIIHRKSDNASIKGTPFIVEPIDDIDVEHTLEHILSQVELTDSETGIPYESIEHASAETGKAPYQILEDALCAQ